MNNHICCYGDETGKPCLNPPTRTVHEQGADPYFVSDTCDEHLAALTTGTTRTDISPEKAAWTVWPIEVDG